MTYDFTYLSLGAGVQSSALLVMSAKGLHGCPKADVAIFADTQSEPHWVHDQLSRLGSFGGIFGIPVIVISAGNLGADLLTGRKPNEKSPRPYFPAIPFWTRGEDGKYSRLKRQCTSDYKIRPITKEVRRLMGYARRRIMVKSVPKARARCLLGISIDEVYRMKPAREPWIENEYPLVDAKMNREACKSLLIEHGLPVPKKSACLFCPYHDDEYWLDLKENHPEIFAKAVEKDAAMRNMTAAGIANPVFLSKALVPLDEVDFPARIRERIALPLFDSFTEECDGVCGV